MSHNRKICVIGLGYAGLPVAVNFARRGRVIGFDSDNERLAELKQGIDLNNAYPPAELHGLDIHYTSNPSDIAPANFYIIVVPTPLHPDKSPDISSLQSASAMVGAFLKPADIVVYESTVYPGATEEDCAPILERHSGLTLGDDFFIGYSPERVNPGDKEHVFANTKKVVAAQTDEIRDVIANVYETVIEAGTYKAPSIKVAETAKAIENTQRDINIALVNELMLICEKLDIDTLDVLETAGTKWNFLAFTPGLVGGHCIGIDPYYLTHKASMIGYSPQVILAGRSVNEGVGRNIANRVIKMLNNNNSTRPIVTILGVTFKENVPDMRNSKVKDMIDQLAGAGIELQLSDPIADRKAARTILNIDLTDFESIKPADAIIFAVAHQAYRELKWDDISTLIDGTGIVFDLKGILSRGNIPDHITLMRP